MMRADDQKCKTFVGIWLLCVVIFMTNVGAIRGVFAQEYVDRYSHFFYELEAGEGSDDAVVFVNSDRESRDIALDVVDSVFGEDGIESVSGGDTTQESGTLSMRDWIRFYPTERPIGSRDIELLLGGSYPSRLYPLCQKLAFGTLEKSELEQFVVQALRRTLVPAEMRWLSTVSKWCQGVTNPVVRIAAGGSARVPFVFMLPSGVTPSSYRGFIIGKSDHGTFPAATIDIRMPGTQPPVMIVDGPVISRSSGTNQITVSVRAQNDGGESAIAKPHLLIERKWFASDQAVYSLEDREVAAGAMVEFVWHIARPLFGTMMITPKIVFYGRDGNEVRLARELEPIELFVSPPAWILIVLVASMLVVFLLILSRLYWERRWVRMMRGSYVFYSPDSATTVRELADRFGVNPRTFSKINDLDVADAVRPTDVVLAPPVFIQKIQKTSQIKRALQNVVSKKRTQRNKQVMRRAVK